MNYCVALQSVLLQLIQYLLEESYGNVVIIPYLICCSAASPLKSNHLWFKAPPRHIHLIYYHIQVLQMPDLSGSLSFNYQQLQSSCYVSGTVLDSEKHQ